ncbi:polysaccharide biosynthesis tyrosine autokinase [Pontibacter sp. JH31]|uniref:non-specific protein-tyrosine kinase n=1 Tax=Pontibacter aquaedesilientis TaxID=2766980 RepID=A0ABR7XBF1_9BACT|nr:tyrosine-protein kinase [Pontibacter aquaedesilientis]MBD1395629.1 polysaccharide biosynthesis tyrosine autokinase [Pontibacter aquaedesilientis]
MKRKNTEHEIDLRSWLFKFRSRWYLFLAFTLVSLAGAYVFVKSSTRIYAFKSTLLLGDQHTGSKKAQELLNLLDVQNKGIKVEDEIGIITSTDMVRTTLKRLDFSVSYFKVPNHWLNTGFDLIKEEQYDNAPFVVKLDTSSLQLVDVPLEVRVLNDKQYELKVKADNTVLYDFKEHSIQQPVSDIEYTKVLEFGKPFKDKYLSLTIERANPDDKIDAKKHYFVLNSMESQVGQYSSSLHVAPIERDARVLELSTKGAIPAKEMLFLNTLMDTYVSRDLEEKNLNGQKTLEFIDGQIASLTDSLRQSKQALSSFRSSNRIANLDVQSNISYEKLSQLEMERSKLSTEKQYYVTVLDQIEDNQSFTQAVSPAVAGVQNPNLANLFSELSRLNQQKAKYSVSATQDNPQMQVIDSEIKSTRNAIVANIKNLIRSTDISINNINSRIGQLESSIAKVPENERRMMDLQSQADFVSKKYDFLLEKRAEAAIALATNTTDKKIVDKAAQWGTGPQNVKPNMIFMLAMIIGLIIPAALIVLLDNVDNTIQGKNDLNNVTNIPFLGVIAHGSKTDKLAVKNNPRSAIAESFRSIRINLQYLMSDKPFKVIGVTSSVSGEGKTFTSVNLSSELAMSGKRTLLIESDMRKPTFGKYFNTHNAAGLSSYLEQGMPLEEVIQKTDIENLDIISCGPIPENAIKLLEQKKMSDLIAKLREQYDYIVIDTPPIGFVAEYFILMKHMDTNLYVVKHKYTSKDMLTQVNELYAAKKLKNIHMVINDLDYNNTYEYGYKKKGSYYYA